VLFVSVQSAENFSTQQDTKYLKTAGAFNFKQARILSGHVLSRFFFSLKQKMHYRCDDANSCVKYRQ
jgi:hypothetical protein